MRFEANVWPKSTHLGASRENVGTTGVKQVLHTRDHRQERNSKRNQGDSELTPKALRLSNFRVAQSR